MRLNREEVEDVYPLSPMQQGLLFHSLEAPESGVYTIQLCCRIDGPLDRDALRRAWARVIERHGVLRTSFVWKRTRRPLQVVHRQVEPEWSVEDWRDADPAVQRERLDELLASDRRRGFDLHRAPLLRFHLLRLAAQSHRFVFSVHHLVVDGWSVSLLLGEVLTLYAAAASGASVDLPARRPFGDYVAWLDERAPEDAEAFWRQRLADLGETTPLPAACGRGGGVAAVHRHLGASRSEELRSFARRHELTLNTLFQTAWALVLGRWADRRDVVFGTVVSGRPAELAGAGDMVGLFINTLPLRVALPPGSARLELLRAVQEEAARGRDYEHTPLVEIQGWSGLPRGRPLFETILVFENYPAERAVEEGRERSGDALGVSVGEVESVEQTSYPLTLAVMPGDDVTVRLEYDGPRCDANVARRLLEHLIIVLDGLTVAPGEPVGHLDLVSAAERQQTLREWNDSHRRFDLDVTVPARVRARAAETPQATAVIRGDRRVTYARLAGETAAFVGGLRSRGVGRGDVVAVEARRTLELPALVLAILAAGAVYLPLDPAHPRRRLGYLLDDSGARWLVTTGTAGQMAGDGAVPLPAGVEVLSLEELGDGPAAAPTVSPASRDAAYVIYTSGSTGQPKGVVVQHGALVNRLLGGQERCPLEAGDRVLQSAALSFDFSVWELLAPLLVGGAVVLPDGDAADPSHLGDLLRRHRVTVAHSVPSVGRVLLDQGVLGDLPDLRLFFLGGEAPEPELVGGLLATTGARVYNQYGPTEATVDATCWRCLPDDGRDGAAVPMGAPLPNYRAYVLDARLGPLPGGAAGELFLAGPGLARGYLGRPRLTAERFLPDPFGRHPGGRLYRTGDRARWRHRGVLQFLGRTDDQVQVRGVRVELGEVEAAIAAHPRVRRAVASLRNGDGGDRTLVAWIVPRDGEEAPAAELRAFLEERIPRFMVPSRFVSVGELSLTPAGKVDRSALPEPAAGSAAARVVEPGVTPMEEVVAAVFADVLGRDAVSRLDDFFTLGGHSLLATQVVARLRQTCGVELPLRVVFEAPTAADLAPRVDAAMRRDEGLTAPPLEPTERNGDLLPLSFGQERLWLMHRLDPDNPAYNLPWAVRLAGRPPLEVLERSLSELERRHEVLRGVFVERDGEPRFRVSPPRCRRLPSVDLSHLPPEVAQRVGARLAEAEARRPFDLSRGPLLRVRLILHPEDYEVLFVAHHIVTDGWSSTILVREMTALFEAFSQGRPSPLAELPIQYGDYARWQRRWIRGEVRRSLVDYWRRRLAGAPGLRLPTDAADGPRQGQTGSFLSFTIPPRTAGRLGNLAHRCGATLFMVLLAGFKALLHRTTGQEDMVVGTDVAGRDRIETSELVGFFVNNLVLRNDLSGDPSFAELVGRVRETTLDAFAHQDLPYDDLVRALRPQRDPARTTPLFRLLFVLQNLPRVHLDTPGTGDASWRGFHLGVSKFDLAVFLSESGEAITGTFNFSDELFEPATLESLTVGYRHLLDHASREPEQRLSRLDLSGGADGESRRRTTAGVEALRGRRTAVAGRRQGSSGDSSPKSPSGATREGES